MIISYHGKQFIKLQQGDFTLAYNPISKESKLGTKATRFGSNITLISVRHPDFNGIENTQYGDAQPLLVQGPGSYEQAGVTINGFETRTFIKGEEYINTIYFVAFEGVRYGFLGSLSDPSLDQAIRDFNEDVDVLFVPIGGGDILNPNQAAKVIKSFSPKVIIPFDYGADRDADSLTQFMKEIGAHTEGIDKYVFKSSELDKLTGHLVILNEQ
jgi:hypothetical protein